MERTFSIGEIAHYFDIAPSTLRYWEEIGVLTPQKNMKNSYREYRISDLMSISDILFYQSLGIPLKRIRDMDRIELAAHETNLLTANGNPQPTEACPRAPHPQTAKPYGGAGYNPVSAKSSL